MSSSSFVFVTDNSAEVSFSECYVPQEIEFLMHRDLATVLLLFLPEHQHRLPTIRHPFSPLCMPQLPHLFGLLRREVPLNRCR